MISALNEIFKKNGLSGEYLSLKDCQLIPNSVRADLMKKMKNYVTKILKNLQITLIRKYQLQFLYLDGPLEVIPLKIMFNN